MSDWKAFESYLDEVMKKENIAGAAVAVSINGQIIYKKGFGLSDVETRTLVTPETIFGTASVTKSFTALSIISLEEQGMLSIDDPVVKYIPELKIQGVTDMESIKIHHLLSHTTGVPPIQRKEELNQLEEHVTYLSTHSFELLGEPGEYFSYCNDTFLLLGLIIERLTGKRYRRYVTEHIINTLDMNRSTMSLEELSKLKDVSVPYQYNESTKQFEPQPWPKLGNYEVGGGIRSNVLDLLKYGQVYVGSENRIVQEASVKKMWQPVHKTGHKTYYGLGLMVTPHYQGYTLVEHGGGQPGVSSNFGFIPEENLVVAVLTNVGGVSSGNIWLAAVNTALNLPLETKRAIEPMYEEISEPFLTRFIGQYSCEEGGQFEVVLEEGKLYAVVGDKKFQLRASDTDTLVSDEVGSRIRFFFKENNRPWAALFGSRMLRLQ